MGSTIRDIFRGGLLRLTLTVGLYAIAIMIDQFIVAQGQRNADFYIQNLGFQAAYMQTATFLLTNSMLVGLILYVVSLRALCAFIQISYTMFLLTDMTTQFWNRCDEIIRLGLHDTQPYRVLVPQLPGMLASLFFVYAVSGYLRYVRLYPQGKTIEGQNDFRVPNVFIPCVDFKYLYRLFNNVRAIYRPTRLRTALYYAAWYLFVSAYTGIILNQLDNMRHGMAGARTAPFLVLNWPRAAMADPYLPSALMAGGVLLGMLVYSCILSVCFPNGMPATPVFNNQTQRWEVN